MRPARGDRVEAEPNLTHLDRLRAGGMLVTAIAETVGVPMSRVHSLTKPAERPRIRTVDADMAAAILAIPSPEAPDAGQATGRTGPKVRSDCVPSGPTHDHLDRLRAAGMSVDDIVHAADLPRSSVYALTKAGARERRKQVHPDTEARILAIATPKVPAGTTTGLFVMTFPFYGGPAWTQHRAQRAALQYVLEEAAAQDVVLDAERVAFDWLASRGRRFLVVRAPGSTTTPAAEVVRAAEHLAYAHRTVLPGVAAWIDGRLQQEAAA